MSAHLRICIRIHFLRELMLERANLKEHTIPTNCMCNFECVLNMLYKAMETPLFWCPGHVLAARTHGEPSRDKDCTAVNARP